LSRNYLGSALLLSAVPYLDSTVVALVQQ